MRLIDANSAKASILVVADCMIVDCDWLNGYKTGLLAATETIDAVPTIEAEPVKHGRWIVDENGVIVCSECGEEHEWDEYRATYCEDCGAKMDLP